MSRRMFNDDELFQIITECRNSGLSDFQWCKEHGKTIDEVLAAGKRYGVIWQDGRPFFFPDSIRINLAVPYELVVEAFERLNTYVFQS